MITNDQPEADYDYALYEYLNAELILNIGSNNGQRGSVYKHWQGLHDTHIKHMHTNPFFDTIKYGIEFTGASFEKFKANMIKENMFLQVSWEGKN